MTWMTDEQIDWLLEGTAEMMEHPEVVGDLQVTPELAREIERYEAALERSLLSCLTRLGSTAPSELTEELMGNGEAPLNVLNTLRGEGVGIWDGRWDEYFQSEAQIEELQRCLERDLSKFADDTGGGSLNDAFMNAVFDAVREDLTPNERRRRSIRGGSVQARRSGEENRSRKAIRELREAGFDVLPWHDPDRGGEYVAIVLPREGSSRVSDARDVVGRRQGYQTVETTGGYGMAWQHLPWPRAVPNGRGGAVDEHAADELLMWIDNTAELSPHSSHGQGREIVKNLLRKRAKGQLDLDKSVKLWGYLADAGAKSYAREVGDGRPWHAQFSTETRRAVARELARRFVAEADGGEYDHVDLRIRRNGARDGYTTVATNEAGTVAFHEETSGSEEAAVKRAQDWLNHRPYDRAFVIGPDGQLVWDYSKERSHAHRRSMRGGEPPPLPSPPVAERFRKRR